MTAGTESCARDVVSSAGIVTCYFDDATRTADAACAISFATGSGRDTLVHETRDGGLTWTSVRFGQHINRFRFFRGLCRIRGG